MKRMLSLVFSVVVFQFVDAQTFTANPNQVIPDNQTETIYTLNISGLSSIIDTSWGLEQVCLSITHTWDADLQVKLQSPDGTTVLLFSGVGGSGDNFTNTCFRGDSPNSVGAAAAPFNGTFTAPLGLFNNGQNPNGLWKLLITDMGAQDIGTLLSWKITFGNNPAIPFMFTSSNLPIVKINTLGQPIPNDPKILAHMQMISNASGVRNYVNDTDYYYEGDIRIEIQGYSGSSYPKTHFDFELVDDNGVARDTNLLGMTKESDWMFKSEWTDPSLMRNKITYEMARRMGKYASDTRFCEIVLNGDYIGMYTITEKVKRGADRVDIAKLKPTDISGVNLTGGYIIEMNINGDPGSWNSAYAPSNLNTSPFPVEFKHVYPKSNVIQPQQHDYIKAFTDSFENALHGIQFQDPVAGFRKYADESSFIDFCIVNEFSANYDSYGRSTYMYKEKVTDGNKLHIGPSWDFDRGYDSDPNGGWVYEQTHPYWPFPFWWMRLRDDTEYMKKFYCRYHSLRENVLSTNAFMALVDSTKDILAESYQRNLLRWPELGGNTNYDQVADGMKNFITQRLNWMDQNITDASLQVPILSLNDTLICAGATLTVNVGAQFNYVWSNGSTSGNVMITQSGNYSVMATDAYGCTATDYFSVEVSAPNANFTANEVSLFNYSFSPIFNGISWDWNFGDGSTSSIENPTHIYLAPGNYIVTLTITDSNGCSDTYSQNISTSNVGIYDADILLVDIYPNPFSDVITIKMGNGSNFIRLYDMAGQLLQSKNITTDESQLNLMELSAGIYFIQIDTDAQMIIKKIVKK